MRIGLITYNCPHHKTWEIASRLYLDQADVTLLLVQWEDFPPRHPLIIHRTERYSAFPDIYAKRFGWDVMEYGKEKDIDLYVVGGCQFIPDLVALNTHPGYLPYVRGLDALKWAIYEGMPVGVSVHWTSNETDGGRIVYRKLVPLYFEDTFHSFAYRMYEEEIMSLIGVIHSKDIWGNDISESDEYVSGIVHKRMPPYKERIMLERFEQQRKKSGSIYENKELK